MAALAQRSFTNSGRAPARESERLEGDPASPITLLRIGDEKPAGPKMLSLVLISISSAAMPYAAHIPLQQGTDVSVVVQIVYGTVVPI